MKRGIAAAIASLSMLVSFNASAVVTNLVHVTRVRVYDDGHAIVWIDTTFNSGCSANDRFYIAGNSAGASDQIRIANAALLSSNPIRFDYRRGQCSGSGTVYSTWVEGR